MGWYHALSAVSREMADLAGWDKLLTLVAITCIHGLAVSLSRGGAHQLQQIVFMTY